LDHLNPKKLKNNVHQYDQANEGELEEFIDDSLFVGKDKTIPNWIMVDFRENLDGLTAVLDEVAMEDNPEQKMQEEKTKYVDTKMWETK
jgi:hypothetical protein